MYFFGASVRLTLIPCVLFKDPVQLIIRACFTEREKREGGKGRVGRETEQLDRERHRDR